MGKQGDKFDEGKDRVDLVDPLFIRSVARALTYGADKYGEHNWLQGINQSRIYGALLRHLFAYWQGEDIDQESGNHHLDHAGAMLQMLVRFAKDINYRDFDNRPHRIMDYLGDYPCKQCLQPLKVCKCHEIDHSIVSKLELTNYIDEDLTPSDSEGGC